MRAGCLGALGVEVQGMVLNGKTPLFGDGILALFNFGVVKLLNPPAIDAHQVVVMLAVIDFENRLAGFKEVALEQAGLFKLRQNAIDSGQANIHVFIDEHAIDVFRRHVADIAFFEKLKNFQARKGGFQAHILKALGVAHR